MLSLGAPLEHPLVSLLGDHTLREQAKGLEMGFSQ
jgi:hypothetical protein